MLRCTESMPGLEHKSEDITWPWDASFPQYNRRLKIRKSVLRRSTKRPRRKEVGEGNTKRGTLLSHSKPCCGRQCFLWKTYFVNTIQRLCHNIQDELKGIRDSIFQSEAIINFASFAINLWWRATLKFQDLIFLSQSMPVCLSKGRLFVVSCNQSKDLLRH